MYREFHRIVYTARLSPYERTVFRFRADAIADFAPLVAVPRPDMPHWAIYTDAATNPPMLCTLLRRGDRTSPALHTACSARAPAAWPYLLRLACLIYVSQLLELTLFFEDRAAFLWAKCGWVYRDNNNCLGSLVPGDSIEGVIAVLVVRLWQMVQMFYICLCFPRVDSDLNSADPPTRGK